MGSLSSPRSNCAILPSGASYGSPYTFIHRVPPLPGHGEALVRLHFTGVCHGDVYTRDGGGPVPKVPIRPLVGGHEGIGEIVSLGAACDAYEFAVGDSVGVAWRRQVCRECEACLVGAENDCPQQKIVGLHGDGTFQRYLSFPINELIHVPKSMDKAAACPILCAGVTAYTSLRKMQPQVGKWCAVVGAAGGLGHLAIQYAKVFGLKVVAIDGGRDEKEAFCKKVGCDAYVDFIKSGGHLVEQVKAATGGGADYVLILGPHQSAYDAAGQYVRYRGQIMVVGIGNCSMPLRPIMQKNLTIRSHQTGTKADIEEAMQLSASGKVRCEFDVMSLLELNEALDKIKKGEVLGKIVLDVDAASAGR